MNLLTVTILTSIWIVTMQIPYHDQLALANSLQVGRQGDPNAWDCYDCNELNRPKFSYKVQSPARGIVSIVSVYDQVVILAFRYTATAKNVWQDLMFSIQVPDENTCPQCKIQKEYNHMWEEIKLDVLNDLAKVSAQNLIITGISLGGGLACVSFVDILHVELFSHIQIVTFGSPKVGNDAWSEWFDHKANMKRYYIRKDPIAFMPESIPGLCNYKSTGLPIICNPDTDTCTEMLPSQVKFESPISLVGLALLQLPHYDFNKRHDRFGSIVDHIYGYKKIYNYTLITSGNK